MPTSDILETLKELRGELGALTGERSTEIGMVLDEIAREMAAGNITREEALAALARYPEVGQWLMQRLGLAPVRTSRGIGFGSRSVFVPLGGSGAAVDSQEFICPEAGCDTRWFRRSVGQRPPLCEKHNRRLVAKDTTD